MATPDTRHSSDTEKEPPWCCCSSLRQTAALQFHHPARNQQHPHETTPSIHIACQPPTTSCSTPDHTDSINPRGCFPPCCTYLSLSTNQGHTPGCHCWDAQETRHLLRKPIHILHRPGVQGCTGRERQATSLLPADSHRENFARNEGYRPRTT